MTRIGQDTRKSATTLDVGGKSYHYYDLNAVADKGWGDLSKLPFSLKVLLENLLRHEDGESVTVEDIEGLVRWTEKRASDREINYRPARVLMQDFTGVPGVVDLAAMRDAIEKAGGDANRINPLAPVDLVIDHSVMVDKFGNPQAFEENVEIEYQRNRERYQFLRWGQKAFDNFRVVPPGTGICHQVNLEYLAKGVWSSESEDGNTYAYPDTLVGTDSHTTMINGLGVLGWGVGGMARPRECLEECGSRAHEARGLHCQGSSAIFGAGLQAELALVRDNGAHAVSSTKLDNSRVRPASRPSRVLVEEVPASLHLELVHRDREDQQHLRCPPALLPLNLAHLLGVEVQLEPAEHGARG